VLDVVGGDLARVRGLLAQLLAAVAQRVHAAVGERAGVVRKLLQGGAGLCACVAQSVEPLLGQVLCGPDGLLGAEGGLVGEIGGFVAEGFDGGVHIGLSWMEQRQPAHFLSSI